ncbi:MAG: TlpA disulfide reductase family protein [Bacteroidota bacterium]
MRLIVSLLVVVLMVACKPSTSKEVAVDAQKDNPIEEQSSTSESETPVKFPVYDFAAFEPLLNKEDETIHIINFWATWCKPCIAELPYFERINSEMKDQNVSVTLVSLDMPSMWKSRLEPFVEKKQLQSKVVILDDPKQNDWIPKVSEDWQGGIPATLIYSKSKRAFFERGFTYEELLNEIQPFLQ